MWRACIRRTVRNGSGLGENLKPGPFCGGEAKIEFNDELCETIVFCDDTPTEKETDNREKKKRPCYRPFRPRTLLTQSSKPLRKLLTLY
jgi:hypothetical protein